MSFYKKSHNEVVKEPNVQISRCFKKFSRTEFLVFQKFIVFYFISFANVLVTPKKKL